MSSQFAIQSPAFFEQITQSIMSGNVNPLMLNHYSSDECDTYLTQGTRARFEGNIQALQANYEQAIVVSTAKHAHILMLYANCLTPFGRFSQAAQLMLQADDASPKINYLNDAIYFYGLAGRFHQVVELLRNWEERYPNDQHQFSQLAPKIMTFMDEKKVSDTDLAGLINSVFSLLNQHPLAISQNIIITLPEDEESQWLHYGIPVFDLSVENMVMLDFELADKLVDENFPTHLMGYFVPSFESYLK